jgi:serine phosphatase RsbU (regulator of sigma subunit)
MWCICMGCYITLDPATATAEVVRAGHHDTVLVPAAGQPRALAGGGGLPLGPDAEELYPTTSVRLRAGNLPTSFSMFSSLR